MYNGDHGDEMTMVTMLMKKMMTVRIMVMMLVVMKAIMMMRMMMVMRIRLKKTDSILLSEGLVIHRGGQTQGLCFVL